MRLCLEPYAYWLTLFIVFAIASCLGSFFKLVVDRYDTRQSYVFKPSYCSSCKKNLSWWQNIPILSFLILRGKCFFCSSKIDIHCFLSELITAICAIALFANAYNKGVNLFDIFFIILFFMVLLLLSMFDLKHRIIPHVITYTAIILVIISKYFLGEGVVFAFVSLGIAFLFMDLLYFFTTLIKKFDFSTNLIFLPINIWIIYFLIIQNSYNHYFLFIPIIIYFLSLKFNFNYSFKVYFYSWLLLFLCVILLIYKLVFIDFNLNHLYFFFFGIGIIYFVCEILTSLLTLLFLDRLPKIVENKHPKITIGGGDITVFALISVFVGAKIAFLTLFIASLLAVVSHFILKSIRSEYVPFVPFITVACFIILLVIN